MHQIKAFSLICFAFIFGSINGQGNSFKYKNEFSSFSATCEPDKKIQGIQGIVIHCATAFRSYTSKDTLPTNETVYQDISLKDEQGNPVKFKPDVFIPNDHEGNFIINRSIYHWDDKRKENLLLPYWAMDLEPGTHNLTVEIKIRGLYPKQSELSSKTFNVTVHKPATYSVRFNVDTLSAVDEDYDFTYHNPDIMFTINLGEKMEYDFYSNHSSNTFPNGRKYSWPILCLSEGDVFDFEIYDEDGGLFTGANDYISTFTINPRDPKFAGYKPVKFKSYSVYLLQLRLKPVEELKETRRITEIRSGTQNGIEGYIVNFSTWQTGMPDREFRVKFNIEGFSTKIAYPNTRVLKGKIDERGVIHMETSGDSATAKIFIPWYEMVLHNNHLMAPVVTADYRILDDNFELKKETIQFPANFEIPVVQEVSVSRVETRTGEWNGAEGIFIRQYVSIPKILFSELKGPSKFLEFPFRIETEEAGSDVTSWTLLPAPYKFSRHYEPVQEILDAEDTVEVFIPFAALKEGGNEKITTTLEVMWKYDGLHYSIGKVQKTVDLTLPKMIPVKIDYLKIKNKAKDDLISRIVIKSGNFLLGDLKEDNDKIDYNFLSTSSVVVSVPENGTLYLCSPDNAWENPVRAEMDACYSIPMANLDLNSEKPQKIKLEDVTIFIKASEASPQDLRSGFPELLKW